MPRQNDLLDKAILITASAFRKQPCNNSNININSRPRMRVYRRCNEMVSAQFALEIPSRMQVVKHVTFAHRNVERESFRDSQKASLLRCSGNNNYEYVCLCDLRLKLTFRYFCLGYNLLSHLPFGRFMVFVSGEAGKEGTIWSDLGF